MEREFFDEEIGGNTPQNETQRNHTPSVSVGNGEKKPKKKVRWWHIVTAICLAFIFFFGGFAVCYATLDGEIRTLLAVKKGIQRDYYKEVSDETFYDAVFQGINENLLDPYSCYMSSEEYAAYVRDGQGNREGIGLVFSGGGEGSLRIVRVSGNSPAEAAGIRAGEWVTGCGKTQDGLTACTTFDEFAGVIDGYAANEEFCLRVRGADGERVVTVSKQAYVECYVFYRTSTESYAFTGEKADVLTAKGAPMSYLNADTAYIRLVEFSGNVSKEFAGAMAKFKEDGKKHLVLDLRGNGGGYLNDMQRIASYFCKSSTEKNPIVAVADYGERRVAYAAAGNYYGDYFAEDSRICVLADSGSASASECLIGCMIDYGAVSYGDICLAERKGVAKTYGKGIMQETQILDLFKQDALKLTTAEILWPKGKCIHGIGILSEEGTKTVAEQTDFEEETRLAIAKLFE